MLMMVRLSFSLWSKLMEENMTITFSVMLIFSGTDRWNSSVGIRHPNVWIFICKLNDEEKQWTGTPFAVHGGAPSKRGDDTDCCRNASSCSREII